MNKEQPVSARDVLEGSDSKTLADEELDSACEQLHGILSRHWTRLVLFVVIPATLAIGGICSLAVLVSPYYLFLLLPTPLFWLAYSIPTRILSRGAYKEVEKALRGVREEQALRRRKERERALGELKEKQRRELEELRKTTGPIERAEELFKQHQAELKLYYDQNLRQSRVIFWIGVGCIILGFAVVGLTILWVSRMPSDGDFTRQIVVSALGSVGAILTNFIAVVYLRMYERTGKSLTEFHNRLVRTHDVHFGNLLAAYIDNATLRNETLSEMAKSMPSRPSVESSSG